uniref:Uncharacterized protein n=1 Tax=Pyrrhoderma lamaoense TaxID=2282106 RepID=A0A5B9RCI5_9AGAM|nr:hypothetical protein PLAO_000056 [Phellinus lamaoensis]QEG57133.1 hypothetical protein PLAO_000056 [Phellinus lamaoensis]
MNMKTLIILILEKTFSTLSTIRHSEIIQALCLIPILFTFYLFVLAYALLITWLLFGIEPSALILWILGIGTVMLTLIAYVNIFLDMRGYYSVEDEEINHILSIVFEVFVGCLKFYILSISFTIMLLLIL